MKTDAADYVSEYQMEIENRIRNVVWTVCGDYTMEARPDLDKYRKAPDIALYDAVKQGAFARYFDREAVSLYLVKKVYLGADEGQLLNISQMCMEAAVGSRIILDFPGSRRLRRRAFTEELAADREKMAARRVGQIKIAWMERALDGSDDHRSDEDPYLAELADLEDITETEDLIAGIDYLYNHWIDPSFVTRCGNLRQVLAVTIEEMQEFDWRDFLSEEMVEENLDQLLEKMSREMVAAPMQPEEEEGEEGGPTVRKITYVTQEDFEKVYSYIERNFGRTYLTPLEEKQRNYRFCKGIHGDCGLYYTKGILQSAVCRNYQYEYARKQMSKNRFTYYDCHRAVKQNIQALTDMFRKTLTIRDETLQVPSDYGSFVPVRAWRAGRVRDPRLFVREQKQEQKDFVVDILIDASGSQRPRQERVVLQAYILMEALSNVGIPHRVTGFCTFWDYTILQQYRDYDDGRSENERIFEFTTSSNNRDGLAIRAIADDLLKRGEEKKILLVLSDGRPYDVIANRPNARNPQPYRGGYAIRDTAMEIRRLRNVGVSVLGIFAGEEKDLAAEKKIFGKDFAYIKDIGHFFKVTGRYLLRQMEE
ncbi:MAG TPA: nitric oxide reductase activation protein [Lachnospiraceae bacterium]|nr:nitric oxide reductase activation protein [Lachnospiraceae bacterium]